MNQWLRLAVASAVLVAGTPALAFDAMSLAGDWLAPAEDADDVDAIVTLVKQPGGWSGRIREIRVTRPDQKLRDDSLCLTCPPPQKGQPFKGLEIIWGLREEGGVLRSGHILDPTDGEVYRCEIHPSSDGKILRVLAYKGLKLLGHTMRWQRR